MTLKAEDEKLIRRYLLGQLAEEEELRQQVEERLFEEDDFSQNVEIVESELIADYVRGALDQKDKESYEKYFRATPTRRQKFQLAKSLISYTESLNLESESRIERNRANWLSKLKPLFATKLQITIYAVLILSLSFGIYRIFSYQSQIDKGLAALSQAYRAERPLESRISGLQYAPFILTRSDNQDRSDYRARERAERILLDAAENDKSPSAYHALGRLFLTKKEFDKAIDQFELALKFDPSNAQLYSDLGAALLEKGRLERRNASSGKAEITLARSLEYLSKALQLNNSLVEARYNRALLHQEMKLTHEAREDWRKYLEIDNSSPWASEARENLRLLDEGNKKISESIEQLYKNFLEAYRIESHELALRSFDLSYNYSGNLIVWKLIENYLDSRLKNRADEAGQMIDALSYIGDVMERGRADRLTADLARYYRVAPSSHLPLLIQARKLMGEGYGLYQVAKNEQAIELYTQAKSLFKQAGNSIEILIADSLIGHSHHMRSDPQRSREIFTKLIPICKKKKYYWMLVHSYCGMANAYESASEFSQAVAAAQQARSLAEQINDSAGTVRCMSLLSNYYLNLGRHDDNLLLGLKGREIDDRLPVDVARRSTFLTLPAMSLIALGYYWAALSYQNEVLKMGEGSKMPRLFARLYVQIGRSYAGLQMYAQAIENVRRGISIGKDLQSDKTGREFIAYGLLNLGGIFLESGNTAEALDAFNEVIKFHQKDDRQIFLYRAHKGRVLSLIALGNDTAAQAEIASVIALYEKYREHILEESNRNSFYHKEQDIYDVAIDFAISKLKDSKQALIYSELSRSRSLLDSSRIGQEIIDDRNLPDLRYTGASQPAEVDEIRRQMPERAQILEYALLKDKLIIWLVSKDFQIECQVVNVSSNELTNKVNNYIALIRKSAGDNETTWQWAGMELYDLLIRPFESRLDKHKQLVIIPDKVLSRLPFGALIKRDSGRFIVEEYRLSNALSANLFLFSTATAAKKEMRPEHVLSVGNPSVDRQAFPMMADLPSAAYEAKKIASYYNSSVLLTGSQAAKSVVLREIENSDVVHLAMHYLPSERSPMLSELPLAVVSTESNDNILRVHEIYNLGRLRPRLVVLSACQTIAEGYYSGEGPTGISRPFQAAGVPLVLASLWPVEARATSELMIEFHRVRKTQNRSTVESLRESQLCLIHSKNLFSHPYYWAAFILIGGYSTY
jgi:CHAT domain-containing protein